MSKLHLSFSAARSVSALARPSRGLRDFLRRPLVALVVVGGLSAAAAPVLLPVPAAGQSLETINTRLERLQRELNTLQRQVYRGGGGSGGSNSAAVARLSVRITEIENELRTVTGKVEQLDHTLGRMEMRVDRLVADVDTRLQTLEMEAVKTARWRKELQGEIGQVRRIAESAREQAAAQPMAAAPTSVAATPPALPRSKPDQPLRTSEDNRRGLLGTLPAKPGDEGAKPVEGDGSDTTSASAAAGAGGDAGARAQAENLLPPGGPKERYDYAFSLLRKADYVQAERAMTAFLTLYPKDELSPNAKYWLGETFYVREDYNQAALVFAEGYQQYPNSHKAPEMLLKLGMALVHLDRKEGACKAFSALDSRFPDIPGNLKLLTARAKKQAQCP